MKIYYAERNGLIKENLQMNFKELLSFFYQTYFYFSNKGYFQSAIRGVYIGSYDDERQLLPPSLAPSAEVFFATKLQSKKVYPIYEYYEYYNEETLFTVIEILYDHIAYYDYEIQELITEAPRKEFCEQINNILRLYKDGFYLEPQNGFIMELPNVALKEQLAYDGKDMGDDVYKKLCTASELYYRFDSNEEIKKKADRNNELLLKMLEKTPDDPYLYFQIGQSYNMVHDDEKACYYYGKGLEYPVEPKLEYVQMMVIGYGYALLHLERYDEALQFQNIYNDFSFSADFVCLMGLIYLRNGLVVQAMKEFLNATTISHVHVEGANSFIPTFNMGCINEVLGDIDTAVTLYRKCGNFKPALDRLAELKR